MTTIAWDGKTLAVDSRVTEGDAIHQGNWKKLRQLPDGSWVTFCGSVARAEEAMHALQDLESDDLPCWSDGTLIVIANKTGLYTYEGRGPLVKCRAKVWAQGSGGHFALGALVYGANAIQAVATAIKCDPSSGGPVKHVTVR